MEISPSFILRSTLHHHTSSITNLCINPDGNTLISCGDDALVVLWDLNTGTHLQDISSPFNGPITAVVWLPTAQGSATAFAFGCADGSIHVYVQQTHQENYAFTSFTSAHGGPIEDIAFELTHHRLASVGHGSLQIWELKSDHTLRPLHPLTERIPVISRSVQFADRGESVLVFYLESHEVIAYDVAPFKKKWSTQIPTRIGYATFSMDQRSILISNLVNGIDRYEISAVSSALHQQQSFKHAIRLNVPLHVASALQGRWIICGSDDGSVRIFDQRTETIIKSLRHGDTETLVQVVACHTDGDNCLIVSGTSSPGPSSIKVWYHTQPLPEVTKTYQEDKVAIPNYKAWQICLVGAISSVAMNQAVMYMPHFLQVSMLMAWKAATYLLQVLLLVAWKATMYMLDLPVQKFVGWGVLGVQTSIHRNATNTTNL